MLRRRRPTGRCGRVPGGWRPAAWLLSGGLLLGLLAGRVDAAPPPDRTADHESRVTAEDEKALARRLSKFPDVVHAAAAQRFPHYVTDHLYALASDFSAFYTNCPVLKSEGTLRASRLALVDLTRRQLARGLELLGIEAPERM